MGRIQDLPLIGRGTPNRLNGGSRRQSRRKAEPFPKWPKRRDPHPDALVRWRDYVMRWRTTAGLHMEATQREAVAAYIARRL